MSSVQAEYVNPVLRELREFIFELAKNHQPDDLLERKTLEDFVLLLMALEEEAMRLHDIVGSNGGDYHFMQGPALSEIIAWCSRAVETIVEVDYQIHFVSFGTWKWKKDDPRETHSLSLRRAQSDNSEPGLQFCGFVFDSLSAWMNNDAMKKQAESELVT